MVQPCDFCLSVVSFDEDYNSNFVVQHDYFHQPCASCDIAQDSVNELCAWCNHLRLRHLIRCVQVHQIWPRAHFYMKPGLLTESSPDDCPLCRIFRHILLSMSHRILLEDLSGCCMELSLGDTDDMIRGWFTSNKFDDMVGPIFHISETGNAAILPLITETISWNSLQEGINYCLQNHKACRNESTIELPPGFRVIDIEEQCIIQVATTTCDFFALSYVWGKDDSPHSKTTKANFFTLSIPGALSSVQLPQTVQDAMTACAQLGRRYLWVDRLCIIQDDLDDKAKQISAMDSIYRLAQYVMVAYGSKDMHSGISGISRPRPQTQMRVRFSGLTVTSDAFDDFCDRDFQGCDYLERGWTYQEFELARRKLCFRNTQAFLECRHGRKEEYHHGFGDLGDEDQTTRRVAPLFSQYTSHIEVYSRRRLTFYSDAIAAISGVLQWLYEGEGEILFGLPARHFDRALLWYHDPADLSRPPNSGFPSWSWAYSLGTRGNLKFRGALWRGHASFRSYEFCGTLIPWYAVSVDGSLRAINASTDDQICPKWRTYANIALKGGCVANSSCTLHDPVTVNERWPDHDTYIQAILSQNVTCLADLDVPGDLLQDSLIPKKGLLLTLAQTLTLNWKLNPFETDTGILLLSSTGNRIGEITLLLETQSQYNQLAALWGPTVEVMGISLAILTAPGGGKNWPPGKMVAVEGQEFPDIPVVNVLVIDREGICARRKHLGWVCLEDWVGSEKTWDYLLLS